MRLLAPMLAAVALAASACGGDVVSLDPVAKAADATTSQTSEHVRIAGTVTAANGTRIVMTGTGDFQNSPQLGALNMTIATASKTITITEVLKDWTIYMSSPLFSGQLPGGKTWMSLDLQKAGKALGVDFSTLGGQTPASTLQQLKAAGNVVRVGAATIDGVATTQYRATIDISKLPNGKKLLQLTQVSYEPVQVYVDKAGLLRRIHIAYTSSASGTADMTMDYSNYGEAVSAVVPDASQTYDMTDVAGHALKPIGG
jgi:hypothetical protein